MSEKRQIRIRPADVATAWGTALENGKDVKVPKMFTEAERYGFTKQEADGIRKWASLQPLARSFKSEALKKHNEAMAEIHALGRGADPKREAELKLTIFRERVKNNYAHVWLLAEPGDNYRYSCVLISGSYDECKAWVADNHLEEITEVTFNPDDLKWELDYWEKYLNEKLNKLNE